MVAALKEGGTFELGFPIVPVPAYSRTVAKLRHLCPRLIFVTQFGSSDYSFPFLSNRQKKTGG
jgi:hypothetical protein